MQHKSLAEFGLAGARLRWGEKGCDLAKTQLGCKDVPVLRFLKSALAFDDQLNQHVDELIANFQGTSMHVCDA